MSVPLEGLATYDTDDRVHHARIIAEYRRQALEELKHIRSFQRQHLLHQDPETSTPSAQVPTPQSPGAIQAPEKCTKKRGGKCATEEPLAAAGTTGHDKVLTPRKSGKGIREMFVRTPKKKVCLDRVRFCDC